MNFPAPCRSVVFLATTMVFAASPVGGASITWQVSSGDWSLASNWGGALPTVNDEAYIVDGGTANITQIGETCGTLSLGSSAGSGTVKMTAGSLATIGNEYIGNTGVGNFVQSGGTHAVSPNGILYLGYNTGSSGTYNLSGGSLSTANETIGVSGSGNFMQSGGTHAVSSALYLGNDIGSSGMYSLNGSSLSAANETVGVAGSGSFTQSGGTNTISSALDLGSNSSGSGTYLLSGTGKLSRQYEYVGASGTGNFIQSGGTNSSSELLIGSNSGSSGSYSLSGSGHLSVMSMNSGEFVGLFGGTGSFTQSGGTNATSNLYLGFYSSSSGTYGLSGAGQLSAPNEYVGSGPSTSALFQQTGGSNTTGYLSVSSGGRYLLSGGTLRIDSGGIASGGTIDGGGGKGTLTTAGSSILDFSQGSLVNSQSMSVIVGPNSLVITPSGFSTSTGFGSYSCAGLTHTVGTTLVVSAGTGFGGQGTITDPVTCSGTITAASSGSINLNNGLTLSGTGNVNLGAGGLTVNDASSMITGGSLSTAVHYIGYSYSGTGGSTGTFTQSGGNNSTGSFYLGYNPGDSGSYGLSGTGKLSGQLEYVGYFGTGNLTQSGGTNTAASLYLGNAGATASGTYTLSGSGLLSISNTGGDYSEYVGYSGTGSFTQSGGTNSTSNLYLGYNSGSSGTYNLNHGALATYSISAGSGTAAFNLGGGTLLTDGNLTMPVTLTGSGGGATIDTASAASVSALLSGPGSLTKVDSGTLVLAVDNTYNGNTLVSGGTLLLGSDLALQNSTLDTSGSGSLSFGTLTSATFGGLQGSGGLTLNNSVSAAVALSVGGNNASTTLAGVLSGSGSLTKVGTGLLKLSGSNTYSGGTTIIAGTLQAGSSSAFGRAASASLIFSPGSTGTVQLNGNNITVIALQTDATTVGTPVVESGSATAGTDTLTVNNAASNTYGGVLQDGSTRLLALTASGTAPLTLPATNSYSGVTTLGTSAMLVVTTLADGGSPSGLGKSSSAAANLALGGYSTLSYVGGAASTNRSFTMNASAAGQSFFLDASGTGAIDFTSTATPSFETSSTKTHILVLTGDNTGDNILAANLANAGTGATSLLKTGPGLWVIAGANNSYTGGATVSSGTLKVDGSLGGNIPGTLSLGSTGGGATFEFDNTAGAGTGSLTVPTLSTTISQPADNTVVLTRTATAQNVSLTFTSVSTDNSENGNVINFVLAGTPGIMGTNSKIILADQRTYAITNQNAYFNGGDFAVYDTSGGTGTKGFVRAINYGVDANSATSSGSISTTDNQQITGNISGQNSVTLGTSSVNGTLKIDGPYSITMNSGQTLTITGSGDSGADGILKTGGGTSTISGGAALALTNTQGDIRVDTAADVLNIAMPLSLNSAMRFMKSGDGTLVLSSGSFSLTGNGAGNNGTNTFINGGVLEIGGSATIAPNAANTGTKGTFYIADSAMFAYNSSSVTSSIAAVIAGPGSVSVSSGRLELSGSNTFSGQLTVRGGTLAVATVNDTSSSGPLGNSALSVAIGSSGSVGTLEYTGGSGTGTKPFTIAGGTGAIQVDSASAVLNLAGAIDGGGSLDKTGSGTLALSASNSYTGTTLVSSGTLLLANLAAIAGSTFDTSGSGTLSFGTLASATFGGLQGSGNLTLNNKSPAAVALSVGGNNTSTTFSGILSGSGGLTKTGSGIFSVTGPNTFSGQTTISGGTLQVLSGNLLASNEYVGTSGPAGMAQSGGTNAMPAGSTLSLGYNTGASGTYNLSAGSLWATNENIGDSGTGIFTQSGGTNSSSALAVGNSLGSNGTYNLIGAALFAAGSELIGNSGIGNFTQSGGTNSMSVLYLANNPAGSGTYNLSGNGLLTASTEYIGYSGSDSFTQSGGTNAVSGYLALGFQSSTIATYKLSGSGLLTAAFEEIGYESGPGSFMQSEGTNATTIGINIGVFTRARANSGLTGQLPKMCNLNCENRNNLLCQ